MSTFIRSRTYLTFLTFALCVIPTHKAEAGNNFTQRLHQGGKLVRPPIPQTESGGIRCTKARYVRGEKQFGLASWYGNSHHGKRTSSGETFDQEGLTIAHLTLPMGTNVIIESLATGKTVKAKVNDCGPYKSEEEYGLNRIADLSKGVADALGVRQLGISRIIIHVL